MGKFKFPKEEGIILRCTECPMIENCPHNDTYSTCKINNMINEHHNQIESLCQIIFEFESIINKEKTT